MTKPGLILVLPRYLYLYEFKRFGHQYAILPLIVYVLPTFIYIHSGNHLYLKTNLSFRHFLADTYYNEDQYVFSFPIFFTMPKTPGTRIK